MVIPVTIIIFVILFSIFESVRAILYINGLKDYKNSVSVLQLKDSIVNLQNLVSDGSSSYFCSIDQSKLSTSDAENNATKVMKTVNEQIKIVGQTPVYNSLVNFLPKPKNAKKLSNDLNQASLDIVKLSTEDARSDYCVKLENALYNSKFLQDLQKPEGVSALLPGQLENYQSKLKNTQETMLAMKFPTEFKEDHVKAIEVLNKVAVDLRADDNNYKQFSRSIEADLKSLDEVLASIRSKTLDLQDTPKQIDIAVSFFE